MVRHAPGALFEKLEGDGFLAFYAKRIDGIRDVNGRHIGELRNQAHAIVEISGDLADDGAVIHALCEFRGTDLALRQENRALQLGAGGVGGKAGGGVAGAGADHGLRAEQFRLGDGCGHAGVLERRRRIASLMFQTQRGEAGVLRRARSIVERRIAFKKRDDQRVLIERKQFTEAPDAAAVARIVRSRARVPTFAKIRDRFQQLERDFDFQRAAATRAHVNLFSDGVLRGASGHDATLHGSGAGLRRGFCDGVTHFCATEVVSCELRVSRANSWCTASSARFMSWLDATNEILVSEEPWAMAIIFIFSRPSTLKVRPAMPTVPRIFSPTTATMAMLGSRVICSTFWCIRSWANCWRSASTVRLASEEKTMKQISFCEEDCEISRTFARTLAVVENVRPTTSGRPTIPGPPTAMSETSRMAVSALTPALEAWPCGVIFVPGCSGSKVLRIQTGMPDSVTARSVLGCSTLAPKWASSAASR